MLFNWRNLTRLQSALLFLASLVLVSGCATTPRHHTSNAGAELKKSAGKVRILVLPMDIELYEISVGGIPSLKAGWTEAGRENVRAVIKSYFQSRKINHISYQKEQGEKESHTQFFRLLNEVGNAMLFHYETPNLKLPAKENLDWSVGGISKILKNEYNADYALYVHIKDHHSSSGRVAMGVFLAMAGVAISSGAQIGWAYLVNLESGEVAWFDFIRSSSFGDIRNREGADQAIDTLLTGFPQ